MPYDPNDMLNDLTNDELQNEEVFKRYTEECQKLYQTYRETLFVPFLDKHRASLGHMDLLHCVFIDSMFREYLLQKQLRTEDNPHDPALQKQVLQEFTSLLLRALVLTTANPRGKS